jgi:hypothetical protein
MNNIDFQPVPKRFMVWDKETKAFWYDFGGQNLIFESEIRLGLWLANRKEVHGLDLNRFIIIQSTNLFDKDGNEIFEGSIVYCESDDEYGYVEYDHDEGKYMVIVDNIASDFSCGGDYYGVVGHILSNPELLGSKNV